MDEFLHHCAVLIQAQFRGYQCRKYYRLFLPVMRRLRALLAALVAGWRVRRVMKTSLVRRKICAVR